MSSNTTLSGAARRRLFTFNGFVWIFGLVVIVIVAAVTIGEAADGVSVPDDYAYEPWLNPQPVLADEETDGVYSGVDGAVIRLEGLDPAQPLLLTELDGTYVGTVSVTGPGGEVLAESEYGGPAEFDSYLGGEGQWVIVPQADVELWIDGFRDERWRLRITAPPVEQRSGTVSGIGPAVFALDATATTARVSMRGEGRVSIETVTADGVTEVFSESEPTDRSIAWADGDPVLFVIDAWDDAGWTIVFAEDEASSPPRLTLAHARAERNGGGSLMNGAERIRRFSLVTWIVGTIVIAVIAFVVLPQVAVNPQTGEVYVGEPGEEDDAPWLADDPQEYEIVDGVIHGTADGGFLRIDGGSELVMIENHEGAGEADWVRVYQQQGVEFDEDSDAWQYPGYLGSLYPDSDILVLPGADDGLLWFAPSLTDWTAEVSQPEVVPMGETASGEGNAVLMYDGPALSGRFQHTGTGLFMVAVVSVGEWDLLVNEFDEVDVRASWEPTDRVVFQVEADTGDGSWTIALDTPAGDPAPTTTPTNTPTP